ncbi:MAG: SpoIIE family protein phosphatase [Eubacteriales bacterium]|nr:SpoIIE family protein phosphatase [Eubacteriales bacterium]
MNTYLQLFGQGMVVVVLSIIMYLLKKKTEFSKISKRNRNVIYGFVFGIASIFGTVFGVNTAGAIANVRDAAPLAAGLFFSAPSGIIAGIIGGTFRWLSPTAGDYSRLACSISTVIAGFMSGLVREKMLEKSRPSWSMAFVIGVVMEVLHMVLLFMTHFKDSEQAFLIVKSVAVPMIMGNAFTISLTAFILEFFNRVHYKGAQLKPVSFRFQQGMLIVMVLSYFLTTGFIYQLQTQVAKRDTEKLIDTNIADVEIEIEERQEEALVETTKTIAREYKMDIGNGVSLTDYMKELGVDEINIVNRDGIITASTEPEYVGFDMKSGEQSSKFMVLSDASGTTIVQKFTNVAYNENDASRARQYAGTGLGNGEYIQVGMGYASLARSLSRVTNGIGRNRRIGKTGYLIITDTEGNMISAKDGEAEVEHLGELGIDIAELKMDKLFETVLYGEKCFVKVNEKNGSWVFGVVPEAEVYAERNSEIFINSFMEVLAYALLFVIIFALIKIVIVNDIVKINETLGEIKKGDLTRRIDLKTSKEMKVLTEHINSTVDKVTELLEAEKQRIAKELELAKDIQNSALPQVYPAFPDVPEIDVYATVTPAKEVGGDFYDFYRCGTDEIAFLVADVSGKGVPAAMFMMRAKTLIHTIVGTMDLADAAVAINDNLCTGNDAGMFVTAFVGVFNFKTGHLEYVNAGHNPPVYMPADGECEYMKKRSGLIFAGMEGVPYKKHEMDLKKGDKLFLYTDGVTEANDPDNTLYGEERLIGLLSNIKGEEITDIVSDVFKDIEVFVRGAEQFDDITMLTLEYK